MPRGRERRHSHVDWTAEVFERVRLHRQDTKQTPRFQVLLLQVLPSYRFLLGLLLGIIAVVIIAVSDTKTSLDEQKPSGKRTPWQCPKGRQNNAYSKRTGLCAGARRLPALAAIFPESNVGDTIVATKKGDPSGNGHCWTLSQVAILFTAVGLSRKTLRKKLACSASTIWCSPPA